MTECIYFSYEDITPWHGDVFDHPDYEYYCLVGEEKKKIFPWTCSGCPYYEEKKNNEEDQELAPSL